MQEKKKFLVDGAFMLLVLAMAYLINVILQNLYDTKSLIPMIFVLGVFLVAYRTQGYFWGLTASLISVLAVNYAFTYPYYAFDLIRPECLASAVVMLIVAIMTGAMTTQIKKQEKAKTEAERERMRGNLLRAISHDLRTPLTAIYGSCSALLDNYEELSLAQQQKLLKDMQADSQWLVRMVENLLSITRIDAGNVRLTKKDTVLEELIDAVLVKFHKRCPEAVVQLRIPEEFLCIPMDGILIEQVLLNLLENAVTHAAGMNNLQLFVEIQDNWAVFRVMDDGCGIPEWKLPSIFTGMQNTQESPDIGRSNMGIGLSVCATIIKAHGGEITAENRPNGGAEFRFTLGLEESGNEQ